MKQKGKLRVGVFLGGSSSERAISLRSGKAIYETLRSGGIQTVKIDPKNSFKNLLKKHSINVAFLALHGKGGEDGVIQRELEKLNVPYTGSSAKASQVAFDKYKSKKVFERAGIQTPEWTVVTRKNFRSRLKKMAFPVFSKPIADGSSIGIHCVESYDDFLKNYKKLFGKEKQLLVERKIDGREITVGVLDKKALPVIELKPKRFFYDYKAKYTSGQTRYLVPAPISEALARKAKRMALKTHRALGLRDFSRVDIMVDSKGRMYVLEANTIPGFTDLSLFPKAAAEAGISFLELCKKLINLSEKRMKYAKKG